MRTRVKICGITREQDALDVAKAGADAIGLVFYQKSPRHVTVSQAKAIVKVLPAFVTVVVLFVDASAEEIEQIISQVPVDCLQFHGDETAEFCRQFNKPYIKAVRMQSTTNLDVVSSEFHDARALLLDAYETDSKGGTGKQFNWNLIPPQRSHPIILAGGLHPDNVKEAITGVSPYALDVSSGVESAKGIKDKEKITAFINNTDNTRI